MTVNEFEQKYLFDTRFEFCSNCKHCKIMTSIPEQLICYNPELDKQIDGMFVYETSYCDAWEEKED